MDYHAKRWRQKREKILKRDKYQCQYWKRYGKNREAVIVHHIYPVAEFPEYTWADWNLISLSAEAHERMHDKERGRLTEAGEKLKKSADRNKKGYPPIFAKKNKKQRNR